MKKTKKGFTLVELVIVVAVMAILVAVAIPTVSAITKSAQDSVDSTNAKTIESMIKLEKAEIENPNPNTSPAPPSTFDAAAIKNALDEAGLGIEKGDFIYDDATGACTVSTAAPTGKQYKISISGGTVTVSTPAPAGGEGGEGGES